MGQFVQRLHYGKVVSVPQRLLRFLLWPQSLVYHLVMSLRRKLYGSGWLRSETVAVPTISIGNVTTGGTGKTPATIMVAASLSARGRKVGILSRGYRSAAETTGVVFAADRADALDSAQVGDEVAMMAKKLPGCWFGVGKDRIRNARQLQEKQGIECLILDDGFQLLRFKRDLNIVVVDAQSAFGNGWLLPAGPLREPLSSLRAADLVLLSRTEGVPEAELANLVGIITSQVDPNSIFKLRTRLVAVTDCVSRQPISWESRRLWLFCGIGNPEAFAALVRAGGGDVLGQTAFRDHHIFTDHELTELQEILASKQADLLLTTEKDAARLSPGAFASGQCAIVEIAFEFVDRADIFWGIVTRCATAQV